MVWIKEKKLEQVKDLFKEGDFIYCSWGYDQTNIDFARIIEVSDTQKSIKAKLVKTKRAKARTSSKTSKQIVPTTETLGDPFRLYTRSVNGEDVSFKGSYPFCGGDEEKGTRMGLFMLWDDYKAKRETISQFGH